MEVVKYLLVSNVRSFILLKHSSKSRSNRNHSLVDTSVYEKIMISSIQKEIQFDTFYQINSREVLTEQSQLIDIGQDQNFISMESLYCLVIYIQLGGRILKSAKYACYLGIQKETFIFWLELEAQRFAEKMLATVPPIH